MGIVSVVVGVKKKKKTFVPGSIDLNHPNQLLNHPNKSLNGFAFEENNHP